MSLTRFELKWNKYGDNTSNKYNLLKEEMRLAAETRIEKVEAELRRRLIPFT